MAAIVLVTSKLDSCREGKSKEGDTARDESRKKSCIAPFIEGGIRRPLFSPTKNRRENPCWFLPATLFPPGSGLRSPAARQESSSSSCPFLFGVRTTFCKYRPERRPLVIVPGTKVDCLDAPTPIGLDYQEVPIVLCQSAARCFKGSG